MLTGTPLRILPLLALIAVLIAPAFVGAYPQGTNWSSASSRATSTPRTTTATPTGTQTSASTSSMRSSSMLTSLTPATSSSSSSSVAPTLTTVTLTVFPMISDTHPTPISDNASGTVSSFIHDGGDRDADHSSLPPQDVQEMIISTLMTLGQNPDSISAAALTSVAAAANSENATHIPPPSPTAFVRYLGDGTAFIENLGYNFTQVQEQCRGMQGELPIENVVINTMYPDGRPAYGLQFFGEWACQGRVLGTTTGYTGNGRALRGSDGRIVIPRSSRFVSIFI